MKQKHDPSHVAEFFIRAGLIAAFAGALLMPMTINVHGNNGTPSPAFKHSRSG